MFDHNPGVKSVMALVKGPKHIKASCLSVCFRGDTNSEREGAGTGREASAHDITARLFSDDGFPEILLRFLLFFHET
jgi:hypothetical protein